MMKIDELKPQMIRRTIEGRIARKTKITKNKNGKEKYFSFYFNDNSGKPRVVAYTNCCEKCSKIINEDNCFSISGGSVQEAAFNNIHNFQVTLNNNSVINPIVRENLHNNRSVYKNINFQN